jgi:hypothetical protein
VPCVKVLGLVDVVVKVQSIFKLSQGSINI